MSKKRLNEDFLEGKFFDDDEEDDNLYINQSNIKKDESDDVDPLDLYMLEMNNQIKNDKGAPKNLNIETFENEDPIESQYLEMKQKKLIKSSDSDGDQESDELKKKKIEPLAAIDRSQIKYELFNKCFYIEHEQIQNLSQGQVDKIRKDLQIRVKGDNICRPITSFAHLNFDQNMLNKISSYEFTKPTSIQSQALPCILQGRDVIGVAKTGSGKTLAYIWPMIIHILDQREVEYKEGPIGIIILPTRELGQQVYLETKKFSKIYGINVCALLGGESKRQQWKELIQGTDIVIATPGRLIDMIKSKATNLNRCTYLVLDEADNMFSLGFEYQIRSIINNVRVDRQTLLFTATMKKKVQQICVDILDKPIVIHIGDTDNAINEDIKQSVIIMDDEEAKIKWLLQNLMGCLQRGKVLIFVNQISQCQALADEIRDKLNMDSLTLHGDKIQQERTQIINAFKQAKNLLVATDIASRGLDIKEIRTVINFQAPKDADIYIHRIGRTGRAGNQDGIAYSLILKDDWKFAILLIKNLELAGQVVSAELEQIAMMDEHFKIDRVKKKMGLEFAKGKDASKMLKQALKRQRNSGNKLGLGYEETPEDIKKRKEEEANKKLKNWEQKPYKKVQMQPFSGAFQNESAMVERKQSQFGGKWEQLNPIQNDPIAYAQSVGINPNAQREEIMNHYQQKMKQQFRSSFVSAGEISKKDNAPRICYLKDNQKNQQEKK